MSAGMIIDSFAGGGGASLGISWALGRGPDVAINHDAEALAMHQANHPETRHLNSNIWRVDPVEATGGKPVSLAWFSPDCKHFSKAKGGKPVKRSIRDLAWVVVLWARRVRPRVICLENVEEFRFWSPLDREGKPCPERKGETFERWCGEFRRLGYRVEWRELRACDYGTPTIRKRLFLVARCDSLPIVWPAPTHGPGRLPYQTAADIIDWSLPCPSIFLSKEEGRRIGVQRPLAEATMARIAKGVQRFIMEAKSPFIVPDAGGLVASFLAYAQQGGAVRDVADPVHTITASRKDCNVLVSAFLAQHNAGSWKSQGGRDLREPVSTITVTGSHQGLVQAFLVKYYGASDHGQDCREPLHTIPTRDRFGLVTVHGQPYEIVDIGMRMLSPRELFRAQGFPDSYIINRRPDGSPLTKTASIRMCGNSVCPQVAEAVVRANTVSITEKPTRRKPAALPLFEEIAA